MNFGLEIRRVQSCMEMRSQAVLCTYIRCYDYLVCGDASILWFEVVMADDRAIIWELLMAPVGCCGENSDQTPFSLRGDAHAEMST